MKHIIWLLNTKTALSGKADRAVFCIILYAISNESSKSGLAQVRFVRYSTSNNLQYQSIETKPSNVYGTSTPADICSKLKMKVQKAGFRKFASSSMPNNLRYQSIETKPSNVYGTSTRAVICSKLKMKVQKAGFQNRAVETLLEKGGSASVHYYVHANRTFQVRFKCDVE